MAPEAMASPDPAVYICRGRAARSWMCSPAWGVKPTLSLVLIEINDKVSPLRAIVTIDTRPIKLSVAMNEIRCLEKAMFSYS